MLKRMNAQQRKAVQNTEGPLLVISGAGTGKTHLLTGKILYLLQEKNIPPNRILALTFTEKATEEMNARVEEELPIGSESVAIKTFHALCESILRERGHEIGIPLDFRIIQGADLGLFLKQHCPALPLERYRPLADPQRFLRALQEYFSRLKDEYITPESYLAFSAQKTTSATTAEEKEYAGRHTEIALIYEAYEQLLIENGFLDFGGLITNVLKLFEKRISVLAEYADQFLYILVDEFQDTNFAQNRLVALLAKKHANVTVVGDDDQSIYKWRGASLTNIHSFKKLFPQAKTFVLNENYRSEQNVLDLAYAVIQKNNPNRLEIQEGIDKKLQAIETKKSQNIPEIRHFSELSEEVEYVVTEGLRSQKKGYDTAILVRTNALALPFLEFLQKEKIHHQHFSAPVLFSKPQIKDCMSLLRVIGNPLDDMALFRFLSLNCWNIPMKTLLAVLQHAREKSAALFDTLEQSDYGSLGNLLDNLIEFARNHKVSEVLGKFLAETHYMDGLNDAASPEAAEHLAAFSEIIKSFEATHAEHRVQDFLEFAKLSEEIGDAQTKSFPLDPTAIKILTMHAAKGLEFDSVFIPGLVKGKFPSISRRDPFEIPAELIPEPLPEGDHHLEEERRLFYVALTRAKHKLILTYSDFYDGKKQWKPSPFIVESLESGKAVLHEPRNKQKSVRMQPPLNFESKKKTSLTLHVPKLSYSQLSTFQTCPLKYQFRYLFKIPAPLPFPVHFGSSIHNALRDFYEYIQKNPASRSQNLLPKLFESYKKNWIPLGYESRALEADQKKAGQRMLEAFYEREKGSHIIPQFLEKSFTLKLEGVTLTGRIDRIDELPDGTHEVIDYKTGEAKGKNLSKDLQLSIYALACRDVFHIKVSKLSLYFLDGLEKISTTRSDTELEKCQNEIIECAKEMAASDFAPTPGFHCQYCDFRLICPAAMVSI